MAKLSKAAATAHLSALALLKKDVLTLDERFEVMETYQEGARHLNGLSGAFFTPWGLARDFAVEVPACRRIIDLCAGIGSLAFAVSTAYEGCGEKAPEIVCVEKDPDYVAAGRKLVPQATWIEADVFDVRGLGHFDVAISNPPFGASARARAPLRYTGGEFEYRVIDLASDLADYGVFLIPQMSAPFAYSGRPCFTATPSARTERFEESTGIVLEPNCGIDASIYRDDWHGVAPSVEIVCADFLEARRRRAPAQGSLFAA